MRALVAVLLLIGGVAAGPAGAAEPVAGAKAAPASVAADIDRLTKQSDAWDKAIVAKDRAGQVADRERADHAPAARRR